MASSTSSFPSASRLALAALPTALEPAARLGAAIGAPNLLTKRDDLAGPVYGGNKVRKLEYLLGDAIARGCDAVVTFGAAGSNHALATAVYAKQVGLDCYAVLTDQIPTPWVANTLRWHCLLGTRIVPTTGFVESQAEAARLRAMHPTGPDKLYEIPWGGSSPLGSLGFVDAGAELAAQLAARRIGGPVRIYLPCGTMGSVAGLLVGLRMARVPATVVSVKVVPQHVVDAAAVLRLAGDICELLRAGTAPSAEDLAAHLEFRGEFAGEGYAIPTPECVEAVALARDLEGLKLDTTYSGKALACLVADARSGRLTGQVPVFWQTWNSRPYPAGLPDADISALPEAFLKFFPP
ncbi:MAG: pyridoxal-phosphate dependent enzyme [Chromatiales bacterium]|nr:pyridoxal-phosphate dependent enzyme [Chromatiales bacterium]